MLRSPPGGLRLHRRPRFSRGVASADSSVEMPLRDPFRAALCHRLVGLVACFSGLLVLRGGREELAAADLTSFETSHCKSDEEHEPRRKLLDPAARSDQAKARREGAEENNREERASRVEPAGLELSGSKKQGR